MFSDTYWTPVEIFSHKNYLDESFNTTYTIFRCGSKLCHTVTRIQITCWELSVEVERMTTRELYSGAITWLNRFQQIEQNATASEKRSRKPQLPFLNGVLTQGVHVVEGIHQKRKNLSVLNKMQTANRWRWWKGLHIDYRCLARVLCKQEVWKYVAVGLSIFQTKDAWDDDHQSLTATCWYSLQKEKLNKTFFCQNAIHFYCLHFLVAPCRGVTYAATRCFSVCLSVCLSIHPWTSPPPHHWSGWQNLSRWKFMPTYRTMLKSCKTFTKMAAKGPKRTKRLIGWIFFFKFEALSLEEFKKEICPPYLAHANWDLNATHTVEIAALRETAKWVEMEVVLVNKIRQDTMLPNILVYFRSGEKGRLSKASMQKTKQTCSISVPDMNEEWKSRNAPSNVNSHCSDKCSCAPMWHVLSLSLSLWMKGVSGH